MTLPRLSFATVLLALTALLVSSCGDDEGDGGSSGAAGDGGAAAASTGAAAGGPSTGGAGGEGAGGGEAGSGGGPGPGGAGSGGGACAPTSGDDACQACMKQSCCAEKTACAGDASCACWLECIHGGTTTQKCFDECGQFSRDAQAQVACSEQECPECGG
jgi:hypothetical protein